jgi:hypothetical protein
MSVCLLLNAFKHRRHSQAWKPLVAIIEGKVHEDPLARVQATVKKV